MDFNIFTGITTSFALFDLRPRFLLPPFGSERDLFPVAVNFTVFNKYIFNES